MKHPIDYSEYVRRLYHSENPNISSCRNVTFVVTEACDLRCTYCVSGDTLIHMADGTQKPISDVKVGESVLSFPEKYGDDANRSTVIETYKHTDNVVKLITTDGYNDSALYITKNHKVLTATCPNVFTPVGDLRIGDRLFDLIGNSSSDGFVLDDGSITVIGIEEVYEPMGVYNIATTEHTYFANGLAVHNCYEAHKCAKYMTFDVAKKIVDLIFKLSETDDSEFINTKTKAVILDFIGGEPLLNIKVIAQTCDYFWHKALELHHRWADTFRISMISNGVNYFKPDVQEFIKKYHNRLSFGITIDGDKDMHDACRIHPDGSGSWEEANAAQMHYHEHYGDTLSTKVTIAPENLEHLDKIIKYFIENGYTEIFANPVYEVEWTVEQSKIYYKKLKHIADYIIDNGLKDKIFISLFDNNLFKPIPEEEQHPYCGGTGDMCAFGTDGKAYPCLRYMELSLNGSQPEICIGNCERGIYQTESEKAILNDMASVTRRSSTTDECYYCPIASGCGNCSAWSYQKHGTYNKKDVGICWMHRARSLANAYYYHKIKDDFTLNLQKEFALQIVDESEYNELLKG